MVTSARPVRFGAVVLASLALTACASQACTTLGCESAVVVDVSAVRDIGALQDGRIMVCVGANSDCGFAEVAKGQGVVPVVLPQGVAGDGAPTADPVEIRVKIMNPGKVLVEGTVTAAFTTVRPNGEGCGPVCYTTRLVATDRGVTALPVQAGVRPTG